MKVYFYPDNDARVILQIFDGFQKLYIWKKRHIIPCDVMPYDMAHMVSYEAQFNRILWNKVRLRST